jgi:hypothetical protein
LVLDDKRSKSNDESLPLGVLPPPSLLVTDINTQCVELEEQVATLTARNEVLRTKLQSMTQDNTLLRSDLYVTHDPPPPTSNILLIHGYVHLVMINVVLIHQPVDYY